MKPIYIKKNGEVSKVSGVINPQTYSADDITYNNTTSGLTADDVQEAIDEVVDGLGTAAGKNYTTSVTQNSTDLVTSGAVWTAIDNLPEPMVFKGTLGTGGTITELPTASASNEGYTYKVITAGTYASQSAKVGDVFVSNGSSWVLIPAGDETFTDTWRAIKVNGTEVLGNSINTGYINHIDGNNTTVAFDVGSSSIAVNASDEKVKQSPNATNSNFEVLFSGTADNTEHTEGVKKAATLRFNPNLGALMEGTNTVASGSNSHAEGAYTTASGEDAHAEGRETKAEGVSSHAEGYKTSASGSSSHAEGDTTIASGTDSHAEGRYTMASGRYGSHAEGYGTLASGDYGAHTEGYNTIASGKSAHAEGYQTTASATYSHASGQYTSAAGVAQTVIGKYNVADTTSLFIVGNGTGVNVRSNAMTVDATGNLSITKINGVTVGDNPKFTDTDRYVNSAAFADDSTSSANSPVKMTLTRAGSDSATVTANIPKVSSSSAGVVPKGTAVSSQSQSTKFLREDGSWAAPSYTTNTDTINQSRYSGTIKASSTGCTNGQIIVGNSDGLFSNLNTGNPFDVTYPILYCGRSIAANGTDTKNFSYIGFAVTSTQSMTLTLYMPVYIKGTLSGKIFTPISTTPLTQTVPTTVDNYHYILLGVAYSAANIYLIEDHRIFAYINGAFQEITNNGVYLPLSGGTMTGDIIFNKTGATDLTQVQMKCGTNDYGRIAAGGTATNSGWMEIATADDGAEPIYARQYSGVYTTLQRTATLLDASGNTSFPGKLTASKAINELLTGTGTTAQDKGSGVSPRYFPALWKMNVGIATPADGDMVTIKIPCVGHDFGVFLSLDNGTTYKPIGLKTQDNTRLTTHYPNGRIITLMYDSTATVDSVFAAAGADARSNITGAWKVVTSYLDGNSNTYDRNLYNAAIKCGTTAIAKNNIIVGKDGVFHHLKDGTAFDISYPILYAAGDIAASATGTNNYDIINFTVTTTQSITLTAYKPVYIKGTLSGKIFTPDSTTPLTQTEPTSADSKFYIFLGMATSTTAIYLQERHPIYCYTATGLGDYARSAYIVNGHTVDKDVPSNAVFTDANVTQTATSTNANYEVLFSATADNTTRTESARKNSNLLFNPSTGVLYGTNEMRSRDFSVSATNGTSGGISLYSASSYIDRFGIAFRKTTNKGKFGYVQGDWATYFTMHNDGSTIRGWTFHNYETGAVASISTNGEAAFAGNVTIGANAANTSGARMNYNSTNKCIEFEFL